MEHFHFLIKTSDKNLSSFIFMIDNFVHIKSRSSICDNAKLYLHLFSLITSILRKPRVKFAKNVTVIPRTR